MVVVMGLVLKITLKHQFTIEIKGMITLFTSAIRLTHGLIKTHSSNKVNYSIPHLLSLDRKKFIIIIK